MNKKIVKLLQMTQSDNPHEALAAIRKANALLARHGLDWDLWLGRQLAPPTVTYGTTFTVNFTTW